MNKFLKRISLVGLLLSTSCGYSSQSTGLALEACVNIGNGQTLCELETDYSLNCNVTVGVLPSGYNLVGENTITDESNTTLLTRDDTDYTWEGSNGSPNAKINPVQFKFKGKKLTLNCLKDAQDNALQSTFTVTQFGEVSCPSITTSGSTTNSTLVLEPTTTGEGENAVTTDNVLLLEPGSKVGSSSEGDSLLVDKGIIDLSKYFKDTNALKQGANLYLTLSNTNTPKIKLFDTNDELDSLITTMNGYQLQEGYHAFENIKLGNNIPSFKQISVGESSLNFSIVAKLFTISNSQVSQAEENFIEQLFDEKISASTENPVSIGVNDLVDQDGNVLITPNMLQTILENKNVTLTGDKNLKLGFTDVLINNQPIKNINLSDIVSDDFTGNIELQGLPNSGTTIDVGNLQEVKLIVNDSVIDKLSVPNDNVNAKVSVSGNVTINKLEIPSSVLVTVEQGSNMKLGKQS